MNISKVHLWFLFWSLSGIGFCQPAEAQVTGQVSNYQVQKIDTLHQVQVPEIIVSALRTPVNISSVPYGVSIRQVPVNTPGLSLAENVSGLPGGLEVDARYNFAVGDKITNRGFGARTQFGVRGVRIVVDGVPVTFVDGQSNLEMIDLHDISYAELLKGPGSSLYGNASGGVLFLHSLPINSEIAFASLSSTIGSNGLYRWDGSLGGKIWHSRIEGNFTKFQYSGFRDHASADYERSYLKFTSSLSLKDELQIQAGYVNFSALNPGALTLQASIQKPAMADSSSVSNAAGQSGYQGQFSAVWTHQGNNSSFFKLTLYDISRSVDNPIIGKIVVLPQNSGGLDFIYGLKTRIGGTMIPWSVGAEMAFRLNHRINYLNNEGAEGMIILNQDEQIAGTGIFFQTLVPVTKKFDIQGSVRFDAIYFGVTDRLTDTTNSNNSGSRIMDRISPSAGLVYHVAKSVNCFINISTSFETPTSTELANQPGHAGGFNPDLNPSHALEFEAGLRGKINTGLNYEFTGYSINTKDELVPYQVPSAPGQDYYRNAGSTARLGLEMSIGWQLLQLLTVTLNTSYINALYTNYIVGGINYNYNKIPGIDQIRNVADLRLHSQQGWYCSALIQSFGTVYANDANSARTNPYLFTNLVIGKEDLNFGNNWIKTLRFSAGISNVFNVRYITSVTINAAEAKYYEPGPGRSLYVNLSLLFGEKYNGG